MVINEDQLAELEQLAKAASPGPWDCGDSEGDCWHTVYGVYSDINDCEAICLLPWRKGKKDAAFIAAANPAVVLELIARVWELEREADWLASHRSRCPWPGAMCTVGTTESDKNECVQCWREAAREACTVE